MIKISKPYLDNNEFNLVKTVLKSGNLVQNKNVFNLENKLSKYLNIKYSILVSSGTAALHLALLSLDIGFGDEVIIPDFSFIATANVIEFVGAKPVFVDIDLDTFCIDSNKIEPLITSKTKAIMLVHEFGNSSNLSDILKLAKKYKLKVIEDAACALGTKYKNKFVGTFGDIGCFSFHPRKSITTGEGGLIITNNIKLDEKIKLLRNHGLKKEDGKLNCIFPGLNYRLNEIQAAIGLAQFKKLNSIIIKKRKLAKYYDIYLGDNKLIKIPSVNKRIFHTYQTYYILFNSYKIRDEIIIELRKKNIESNFGAYAIHCQKYYSKKYSLSKNEFKNSYFAYKNGLALPLSYDMKKKDILLISNIILNYLRFNYEKG